MLLAIDVYYKDSQAKAVGMLFNWEDDRPKKKIVEDFFEIDEYIPGEFYKRELPCIMKIIEKVNLDDVEAIIVDGHVYVDEQGGLGLGGKLYEALEKKTPVIGVAKSSFLPSEKRTSQVYRGKSSKPLYVSSIGIDLNYAVEKIKKMSGSFRIPNILKQLDYNTKHTIV